MTILFHYTDKDGWNGIRSQSDWLFKTSQPRDPDRPKGAYFTDLSPNPGNLRTLYKRLRIPKAKQEFIFGFVGSDGLVRLFEGRGRDKHILFSAVDYRVSEERQRFEGVTTEMKGNFE